MSKWSDKTFNFLTDFVSILIILVLLVLPPGGQSRNRFLVKGNRCCGSRQSRSHHGPRCCRKIKRQDQRNFFTVDISKIRDTLKEIPWVKDVSVKREWPNRLKIFLYLHKPVALWGEQEVLSQDGVIFEENQAVAESEGELPHIYGLPELSAKIYQQYLDFDKICQPRELKIVSLTLTPMSGWFLVFKNSESKTVEVVFKGSDTNQAMSLRLERILNMMPQMKDHLGTHPRKIDARYTKGVAVQRPEIEPEPDDSDVLETEIKDAK